MSGEYTIVQEKELPESQATISNGDNSGKNSDSKVEVDGADAIETLMSFIMMKGDISSLLDESELGPIGERVKREWQSDKGSIKDWRDICERGLDIATQNFGNDQKNYPWAGAANIHYPILTQAAQEWSARAFPELVKTDKVFGVKVFNAPAKRPSPGEIQNDSPQPANQLDAQASQMSMQQAQTDEGIKRLQAVAREARGQRVAHYMNWVVFYKMKNWRTDMDLLLQQLPITGCGFKKVYMTSHGVQSDYVSPLHLTVHNATTNLHDCPRITQDFELYPYMIKSRMRSSQYREIELDYDLSEDSETPRTLLEQYRYEDLDGDDYPEPYIVTVDEKTAQVLRIEPAFGLDDIETDDEGRIIHIDHYQPFPDFKFIPDPRGNFYSTGFAQLLDSITQTVDQSLNQLIDAGNAQIAGGGFIGANLRLQQGGSAEFAPGEYKVVSSPGASLRDSIFERTVPQPSDVTMQTLNILIAAGKDIASIKDIITGEGNPNAPVGTTMALQQQALTVFSSQYKRVYEGLHTECKMMFECLKRYPSDKIRAEYAELTGGDFDEDFDGDGTDIQPVADPTVVTKMQKITVNDTMMQIAQSPLGQAGGMLQPKAAQALLYRMFDTMDIASPEQYISDLPPPNPMEVQEKQVELQKTAAEAQLKQAQAQKAQAEAGKAHAQAGRETMLGVNDAHNLSRKGQDMLDDAVEESQLSGTNAQPQATQPQ